MASLSEIERVGFLSEDIKKFLASHGIHINGEQECEAPALAEQISRPAALVQHNNCAESHDIDPIDMPEELHMANLAFRAVTNGYGDATATFRNRVVSYLKETYPSLLNEQLERIATVANPDKAPGRKSQKKE